MAKKSKKKLKPIRKTAKALRRQILNFFMSPKAMKRKRVARR